VLYLIFTQTNPDLSDTPITSRKAAKKQKIAKKPSNQRKKKPVLKGTSNFTSTFNN